MCTSTETRVTLHSINTPFNRGMNGLERDVLWRTEKGRISAATGDRVHLEPSVGGGIDLVFR